MLEALRRTVRVRTVVLDFGGLEYHFQGRFARFLKTSKRWPEVTNLSVTAGGKYTEIIANHWLQGGLSTPPRVTWYSQLPFRAMSNDAGQLTRVYLGLFQTVIGTRDSPSSLMGPWLKGKLCNQLEWFVLGRHGSWITVGSFNRILEAAWLVCTLRYHLRHHSGILTDRIGWWY